MSASILLAEDHQSTRQMLTLYLRKVGYRVDATADGADAWEKISRNSYDLLILDLMLPGIDGREICRRLRKQSTVPVIMLTALASEPDLIKGFELGADDYISKPFSPRELLARVAARLRHKAGRDVVHFGDLVFDRTGRRFLFRNRELPLTPSEYLILEVLAMTPGRVYSRDELIERAFGHDYEGTTKNVDIHISRLRKHLGETIQNQTYIRTITGRGYKFGGTES
jgi:two-component system, OmpR family, response regulator ResD